MICFVINCSEIKGNAALSVGTVAYEALWNLLHCLVKLIFVRISFAKSGVALLHLLLGLEEEFDHLIAHSFVDWLFVYINYFFQL